MTSKQTKLKLIQDREAKFGKYITGPGHIFNASPKNHEEVIQHGNALAASGNYPVGTDGCFNVGISGGCGPECFVYLEGRCEEPEAMIERLDGVELKAHMELYPSKKNGEINDGNR